MRLQFTKMHGAGNDFVVLDATRQALQLTAAQLRHLGDRRLGVGADQILLVEPPPTPDVDFGYRIFNAASGQEVEHCGNGARCFVRFVHEQGLTDRREVRVRTVNRVLSLQLAEDGRVSVDMGAPVFEHARIPFQPGARVAQPEGDFETWPLAGAAVAVLSMGNPHAVLRVDDVDHAPVATLGPQLETHACFPQRVNVGFAQPLSRQQLRLRVHERDAGETLSCGTGACAAVVAGIRLGWLDRCVEVHTRGDILRIEWPDESASVHMTGPATTVFQGVIEL